ncbi:MAG: PAS domain-containing protein, partial [Acidobacteria bacterium]|nr:PAS domain-containing protein [Acidobacteriota bacterium]
VIDFRISAETKVPVELTLQRIDGSGGQRIFCCAKVVNERFEASIFKQQSEQLLAAAESAEIGLWFWDFGDDRIYSTPRCNELLGLPAYEAVSGETFLTAVHPEDQGVAEEFVKRARAESSKYEEEFRVVYPDGSVEWVCAEGRSFLASEEQAGRMMGILQKITDLKIAGEERTRVTERERRARDEAEEANRAKDFFLAFVSHELRSPLNAILGWAKILLTKEVDEKTRRNALETIERSARFQTKLINDLVDSARVASGKLRLELYPINLSEVIRVSFDAQKPAAAARSIEFEYVTEQDKVTVYADPGRMQQVLTNLISNAIKFTPDGGNVSVRLSVDEDTAEVSVQDTGIGINEAALPHIFRQFSQADTGRAKTNAGLGLGLSIVNILVAKHGGTVEARSEGEGKGSEFVVRLPLYHATRANALEADQPAAESVEWVKG